MANMTLEHFSSTKKALGFLEPTFHSMATAMDRYIDLHCQICPGEVPYYYNERATLSQFVGGVWLSDPSNLVLEEFKAEKVCQEGTYRGRNDIWFRSGGRLSYAEAKQADVQLPLRHGFKIANLLQTLQQECQRAHDNSALDRQHRYLTFPLGMLFLYGWAEEINVAQFAASHQNLLSQIRSSLQAFVKANTFEILWAWYYRADLLQPDRICCFPKGERRAFPTLHTFVCLKTDADYE